MMNRQPLNLILSLTIALLCVVTSHLPAQAADDPQITRWIAELDHDDFTIRQSATEHLILAGPAAVPALVKASQGDSAEVMWRSLHILGEIAVATDFDKLNEAEDSLGRLCQSDNPSIALRASDFMSTLDVSRQSRAISRLQQMGGRIDASGTQLHLDANWKGGDIGLRYVRYIPNLTQVQIEPDAPVTDDGIRKLRTTLPDRVRITQYGSAFLGVGAASNEDSQGMRILTVQPGSPADKAGLQEEDVITRIDDAAIRGFDDLVAAIRKKKVGQEIAIEYSRADPDTGDMKTAVAKVTLGPRAAQSR